MSKEVVTALIAVGGVVLTQFVAYLVSRQNANDLRVNIGREIEIIRKLQPGTKEASKLEAHVSASVAKLTYRDKRSEQLVEVIWTSAPLILASAAALGLHLWLQHGVAKLLGLSVTIVYYQMVAISAWLSLRYVWGLLKLAYGYSRLAWKWTQIVWLQIKTWWVNRNASKMQEKFGALMQIMRDLIAALEQASGDDEKVQAARKKAADDAARRLADIGVTLKSYSVAQY